MSEYETVIGLEIHAELDTESKVFCSCSTRFGAPPNSQTCPVCLGFPGVLPVLNKEVVELSLRAAVAFNCRIARYNVFERKNYFYPDLPKAYQISQKALPLGAEGWVEIEVAGRTKKVRLVDVHMEEDTGKSVHGLDAGWEDKSLIDFNRAGVPLLEIVSQPDMRSVEEAEAYMNETRAILLFLGVSDCRMEQGSLRFEASCSMRPVGSTELGSRVEIKNLNSFRAVTHSLRAELKRQRAVLESGGVVAQETMLWNEEKERTEPMRSKETSSDYRYFPEPDLVPVEITPEWIDRVRSELPELPLRRRQRFRDEFHLSPEAATKLTATRATADFFQKAVELYPHPTPIANWIIGDFTALLNDDRLPLEQAKVTPRHLTDMLKLVDEGVISGKQAKEVFAEVYATGKAPADIVQERGMKQVSDEAALSRLLDDVIAAHPKAVADLKGGNRKTRGFFVGQVMKATKGQANPQLVNKLLTEKLEL